MGRTVGPRYVCGLALLGAVPFDERRDQFGDDFGMCANQPMPRHDVCAPQIRSDGRDHVKKRQRHEVVLGRHDEVHRDLCRSASERDPVGPVEIDAVRAISLKGW